MWPSGTEPFADHSFSTTPTQLLGMKRSVSQAMKSSLAQTTRNARSRNEVNIESLRGGRNCAVGHALCGVPRVSENLGTSRRAFPTGIDPAQAGFASERRTKNALSNLDRGTRRDPPTRLADGLEL